MRVYVPSTLTALRAASEAGEFGPPPLTGYAVTPALREWYTEGDDEELEYIAMAQAARASVGLLAADPDAPRRRVVVALELSATAPAVDESDLGEAELPLTVSLPWSSVVAVHVDAESAAEVVARAADGWQAAQNEDEDAVFTLDASEGEELMWYATQEVPDLLGAEGPRRS